MRWVFCVALLVFADWGRASAIDIIAFPAAIHCRFAFALAGDTGDTAHSSPGAFSSRLFTYSPFPGHFF